MRDGAENVEHECAGRVRAGRLDKIVDAEIVFACVLKDGEALAAYILLRGRDPQIGNGFHGLTMEYGFWYF